MISKKQLAAIIAVAVTATVLIFLIIGLYLFSMSGKKEKTESDDINSSYEGYVRWEKPTEEAEYSGKTAEEEGVVIQHFHGVDTD